MPLPRLIRFSGGAANPAAGLPRTASNRGQVDQNLPDLVLTHRNLPGLELGEANRRLRRLLDDLTAPSAGSHTPALAATPQQMAELLSQLMRTGQWLRAASEDEKAAVAAELAQYREQVDRLRELLPQIQTALLHERARLERERARVRCAANWVQSSRQTL